MRVTRPKWRTMKDDNFRIKRMREISLRGITDVKN